MERQLQDLLVDLHEAIHTETARCLDRLEAGEVKQVLSPPNTELANDERAALEDIAFDPAERRLLEKLIRDAAYSIAYRLLANIDGRGSPIDSDREYIGYNLVHSGHDKPAVELGMLSTYLMETHAVWEKRHGKQLRRKR